jgi:dolichyl-phosphate beta-glucosyltransferase
MLDECIPELDREFGSSWEILLVDDGSTDGTAEFALKWAREHKLRAGAMRICRLAKNRGKGGAVTHGMKHFRGRLAIFADADGASKFADVQKLKAALGDRCDALSVGSRAHMVKTDAVVKRSFIRNFLMYGLHTLLYLFGIRTIADTQCGFKLFTRDAAQMIFPYMHTEGWIFDVEILIIAFKKGIAVAEVPISWHEVAGSKIDLATDSVKMAVDLVVMRFAYWLGIYDERSLTMNYDRKSR